MNPTRAQLDAAEEHLTRAYRWHVVQERAYRYSLDNDGRRRSRATIATCIRAIRAKRKALDATPVVEAARALLAYDGRRKP